MFFYVYVWNYYVLKLLRLETITFSDATLSDINIVLCYVLSQYWHYGYQPISFCNMLTLLLSNDHSIGSRHFCIALLLPDIGTYVHLLLEINKN